MSVYYNDNDARCCAWIRELIADGHLPEGYVDERPIQDVRADELAGYTQCHLFAGIGGWPYALRLAGVPESANIWTGSCPCQPFSVAGKRKGTNDERHCWPEFARLIGQCKPAKVFGEQVASRDGREWLSRVFTDLEKLGYAVAGADLCAASVGSPMRRQRLYWVAYSNIARLERHARDDSLREEQRWNGPDAPGHTTEAGTVGVDSSRLDAVPVLRRIWDEFDALPCADGWRRVAPGSFPLAHGIPERVGLLRGAGNAIVPQVAAAFVKAVNECNQGREWG